MRAAETISQRIAPAAQLLSPLGKDIVDMFRACFLNTLETTYCEEADGTDVYHHRRYSRNVVCGIPACK